MWGYFWDWCGSFKWCRMWRPDSLVGWESTSISLPLWLPCIGCFRIDFKVLMMTYKALNGLGPWYLADRLLPPRSTWITYHSQEGWLRGLTPREARKERTRNQAFSAVAPRLWNNLPSVIRLAPSLGVFKSQLKTWLFRQAFPPVNTWFYFYYHFLFSHFEHHLTLLITIVLNCF